MHAGGQKAAGQTCEFLKAKPGDERTYFMGEDKVD